MKLFRLGGIVFRFNWVFLLLLFVLAFYGYLGETVILFLLVFAHETVHLLAARSRGLEIGAVELFPFGGVATIEDALELDPETESIVSLAGPLFIFLAAAGLLVYAKVPAWQEVNFAIFIRSNLALAFQPAARPCPWTAAVFPRPVFLTALWVFKRPLRQPYRISRAAGALLFYWACTCCLPAIFISTFGSRLFFVLCRGKGADGFPLCFYSRFEPQEADSL